MNDKISVIIPTYNSARYLGEAIASVLAQGYKNLEILVVDDGSNDDTFDVVRRYGSHVQYIRLETNSGGPATPRNIGIKAASGDTVAIFDSDDVMLPGKLKDQMDFLNEHTSIPLVFTNFRNFSLNGDSPADFLADHKDFQAMARTALKKNWYRLAKPESYETLISDTYIGTSGVMFRKWLVNDVGYFDQSVSNSDDVEFFFRVTRKYDIGYIDQVYHRRRVHPGNISARTRALHAKLRVYGRQKAVAMSQKGERELDQFLASVLYSIGYSERINGERLKAVKYYMDSWKHKKNNYRIVLSILRALLPI
jgi:glycosyltransferase involved in cell wall biosynthesis